MKRSILIVALSLGITTGYAQKINVADVPPAVKDAFANKYPGLKAEWQRKGSDFEAEYEGKKISVNMETGKSTKRVIEGSVVIAPDGSVLRVEEEVALKDVPKGIEEYAKNHSKKINEIVRITDKSGSVNYRAESGKEEYLFDATGSFLTKK